MTNTVDYPVIYARLIMFVEVTVSIDVAAPLWAVSDAIYDLANDDRCNCQ